MNININKVIVAGRVCQQPQVKSTTAGINICHFNLVISRKLRSPDGQPREDADFVDVTTFGKTADNCARFLQKGSAVFVEAKLRQETWKDKNTNQNRHRLTLIADRVHFLEAPQRNARNAVADQEIDPAAFSQMASAPRLPPRHTAMGMPAPRAIPPEMMSHEIYDEPDF